MILSAWLEVGDIRESLQKRWNFGCVLKGDLEFASQRNDRRAFLVWEGGLDPLFSLSKQKAGHTEVAQKTLGGGLVIIVSWG